MKKIDLNLFQSQLKQVYLNDTKVSNFISNDSPVYNILYIGNHIKAPMLSSFISIMKQKIDRKFRSINNPKVQKKVIIWGCSTRNAVGFSTQPFETANSTGSLKTKKHTSSSNFQIIYKDLTKSGVKINLNNLRKQHILDNNPNESFNFEFETIFCYFEMHNLTNWRLSTIYLLDLLSENGTFYFADLGGDISILDGNLNTNFETHLKDNGKKEKKDIKNIKEAFSKFKQERNEQFYWSPEISLTDYSALQHFLSSFFHQISKNNLKTTQNNHLILNKSTLKSYRNSKTFSFLYENIPEKCSVKIKNTEVRMDYTINIYLARNFNRERLAKLKNEADTFLVESRVTTPFVKSLNEIPDFSADGLGRKALQTAYQSDILFPNITEKYGMVLPAKVLNSKNSKFLVFKYTENLKKKEFIDISNSFIDDYELQLKENNITDSPSDILFEIMELSFPVFLVFSKSTENSKGWQWQRLLYNETQTLLYYVVHRKRNGSIRNIYFRFSEEILNCNNPEIDSSFKSIFLQSDLKFHKTFSISILQELMKSAYFLHFSEKSEIEQILGYFPSKYIEENKRVVHLGCLFFKEKLITDLNEGIDRVTFSLILARNNVLTRVADYIIHRIGLYHFINNTTLKYARRTAIAAISARNVSHNMGSHVVPNIKSIELGTYNMKELKEHYDTFLDYIQQRNDFINHLSSSSSNWSISTWFVRELMVKFLKQYFLLNNLCSNEGLTIYDYSKYNKEVLNPIKKNNNDIFTEYKNTNNLPSGKKIVLYSSVFYSVAQSLFKTFDNNITINFSEKILKKYNKDLLHKKLRIFGTYDSNTKTLNDAKLIQHNIIFEVRRRLYFSGKKLEVKKYYSEYIDSKDLVDCCKTEIREIIKKSSRKINSKDTSSEQISDYRPFYGVIQDIKQIGTKSQINILTIDSNSNLNLETSLQSPKLKTGSRIVFTIERMINSNKVEGQILEVSTSLHLIHLSPEHDYNKILEGDLKVDIPGGISGFQAFYTILENIVRNASKHNWVVTKEEKKIGKNLEVKIELNEYKNTNFYICKIWTNLDIGNNEINHITRAINEQIQDDIVAPKSLEFKKEYLGTAEIKTNAAFLHNRFSNITTNQVIKGSQIILQDKGNDVLNKDSYLKASQVYDTDNNKLIKRLGYRFKLHKPTDLTIISQNESNIRLKGVEIISDTERLLTPDKESNRIRGAICIIEDPDIDINNIEELSLSDFSFDKLVAFMHHSFINKTNIEKYRECFDNFIMRVDKYPYRILFAVKSYSKIPIIRWNNPEFKSIEINGGMATKDFKMYYNFFYKRIRFVSMEDWINVPECNGSDISESEKIILKTYHLWTTGTFGFRGTSYQINVIDKLNASTETLFSPSLPNIFHQELGYKNDINSDSISHLFSPPTVHLTNKKSLKVCQIRYSRHESHSIFEGSPHLHSENISGKKLSFQLFSILKNENTFHSCKLWLRLLENALINILVIDDRVINYFHKHLKTNPRKRFASQGIFIPSKVELCEYQLIKEGEDNKNIDLLDDLNSTRLRRNEEATNNVNLQKLHIPFDDSKQLMIEVLNFNRHNLKPIKVENGWSNFNSVIIHQSILEKSVSINEKNDQEKIKKIINTIKKYVPSVIITSGRSKSWFGEITKFVPFSVLEELILTDDPDKIVLTELLLNAKI